METLVQPEHSHGAAPVVGARALGLPSSSTLPPAAAYTDAARAVDGELGFDFDVDLAPPECEDPDGHSTLGRIPLAHVVAVTRELALSASVVLTDPWGTRHAIVFEGGALVGQQSDASDLGALASLPEATEIAFFWRRAVIDSRLDTPRPAAEVLLEIARGWNRSRMRQELEALGRAFVVHRAIPFTAMRGTFVEGCIVERWWATQRVRGSVALRGLIDDPIALPFAYALAHLGELHVASRRCSICVD